MKDNEMATKAAFFQYGIEAGIVSEEEIREWAYQIIEKATEPPFEIITLATSHGTNQMHEALSSVKGERDIHEAGKLLLARLASNLNQSAHSIRFVARKAMQIARTTKLPEDIYYSFDRVDDELLLAESNQYGTVESCYQDLVDALKDVSQ